MKTDHLVILPSHTCFDDALDTMVEMLRAAGPDAALHEQLFLVHAIVTPEGYPAMAHAWLEDDREQTAIFSGILTGEKRRFVTPKETYYANQRPLSVTRYTYREAFVLNRQSGHYGPWKPEYRALCRS